MDHKEERITLKNFTWRSKEENVSKRGNIEKKTNIQTSTHM